MRLDHTLLVSLVVSLASSAHGQCYSITDLGTLGGTTNANDISDDGWIVGDSVLPNGDRHAFLWSDGVMTDLGTLGGPESKAHAVNVLGQVTGWANADVDDYRAFLYQDGVMIDIGFLKGGQSSSFAYGLSDNGHIVGSSGGHGFLWSGGNFVDLSLDAPPDQPFLMNPARAVNSSAVVVGGDGDAFIWANGLASDLTPFSPDTSLAQAITETGSIVGHWAIFGLIRAHRWQDGKATDLGNLSGLPNDHSSAFDENSLNMIVGFSSSIDGTGDHAVMWHGDRIIDLNDLLPSGSGWLLKVARGINSSGQVTGTGLHNGQTRAFLLSPVSDCVCDLNCDGFVNGADLGILLVFWGSVSMFPEADFNGDGQIDGQDLGYLLLHWAA